MSPEFSQDGVLESGFVLVGLGAVAQRLARLGGVARDGAEIAWADAQLRHHE